MNEQPDRFDCIAYIVTNGNTSDTALVAEDCDTIQIIISDDNFASGYNSFESNAYHLERWCRENGYGYTKVKHHFIVKGGVVVFASMEPETPC